ncbi:MAG: CidA/LrgA family protein, partial [Marinobacter sp.]
MSMLRGFLTLVLCFMLGEALRLVFLIPVSGGVLGMILMTITLMLKGSVSD